MDYSDLPMILTPKDVSKVLNISLQKTYMLFHSNKFPSEKLKGRYIIPKPRFLKWLGVTETT